MRLTAICPAAMVDDANALAAVLAYGPADLQTFVPGWQDANGTAFYVASWDADDAWVSGAQSALGRPAWDTANVVNMAGAGRAQQALVLWTPTEADPTPPKATVSIMLVIGGMPPLTALAAAGLTKVPETVA